MRVGREILVLRSIWDEHLVGRRGIVTELTLGLVQVAIDKRLVFFSPRDIAIRPRRLLDA